MTGWNLPPGCNVSDLPGNSEQDQRDEALAEKIYDILEPMLKDTNDNIPDDVIFKFMALCGECYQEGYADGQHDQANAGAEDQ